MATSKAKHTDATGKQREKLQAEFIEQQQEAAATMAMATVQKVIDSETVIDATRPVKAEIIVEETTIVSTEADTVTIRVVEDIEHMTFGAGNLFSFKAGQPYLVERALAKHLQEKGYLANVL